MTPFIVLSQRLYSVRDCTQSEIVLSQRLYSVRTANLYNNEIVSIVEEYSIPGNVVTQPGEYMSRLVGLFHIMLMHESIPGVTIPPGTPAGICLIDSSQGWEFAFHICAPSGFDKCFTFVEIITCPMQI